MSRIRSLTILGSVPLVALSSLAIAACGGSRGTKSAAAPAQTQSASSGQATSPPVHATVSVRTAVHVTNTPTKAFRVKPVDTTESVAVGPSGYPVYTFQGETTQHVICQKTASAKTNCWAFWPPVSVRSSRGISKQSGIDGKLGTFSNHGV